MNRQVTTAGQQKVKRLEAELNSSTDSEKNKSKPRNSYVLKLSMIPAPAVPARKLEDFNDPLFARNKTNKESQEINLDRTLTKENSKTLTSKQIKQAASEFNLNIKMEQDIQGLKPYPSETKYAMLSQDNYQNYSSEPKVFKKDTQDKLAYKNIEIQVIKNKNSFDRESLSSIDSRPSVRGPKQNFEFDFDKKISRSLSKNLKEMPRQQSPKGLSRLNQETNEQDIKKFTLSKKYENNSISMSSSSDSDSQKSESDPVNIDEILIKPKVIVPSLKLKLNSDRKKDEKPPVYSKKISISVNKKIPELSSAANFAKKLKNNPEEIQKENPSPIDLNLDSSFEDPNKSEDIRLDSEPKSTLRHIDFEIDSKEVKILHFEDAI